ncbi:MAG: glycosyltransferase family 4 protein [Sphingobacterium sp.]|jgi:glycosyltransferase involved in cell wall biosynthesis|nr:glycosyltransferase family 4 protein [Sphingobacterium sp.]
MHIVFLLPGHGKKPVGGHKVVYQYANLFIRDGYEVSIVYGASGLFEKDSLQDKLKTLLRYLYFKITQDYKPYKWFDLNRKIKLLFRWDLNQTSVPIGDKYICTSVETSYRLNTIDSTSAKFYFIQGYENWKWDDELVTKSWRFPLRKIAISSWLVDLINKSGEKVSLVENGFDFNLFDVDKQICERQCNKVIMLYHRSALKGVENGLKALEIVKLKSPNLRVTLFGTFPRPKDLPEWYEYYKSPNKEILRALYNEAAIFVGTSIEEGWGLTLGESMQCGCAVACTNNKGYSAMALPNKTALVSPTSDIVSMADNILKLIADKELRVTIARNGNKHIRNFTIECAYEKFKRVILSYD